ncbi:GCN5-related N-acetyltransferase [Paenibacillus vortex V453]|uniref:GCN5-related N-acetyltransferase n=1 Tax=Paenibacillus vortex V453 TaxID=715225 RepID=A0A2R9SS51_9BACL|nr:MULTISPECIES: GNAT family N-acetyltransferase [Paenibacillus]AWP26838.1 N-acetyltransferase [Paenibacillus sp. Cedars]EFU40195.1 GCN5-related N-acetyltransferase [Paenibacillus vortex V453]
MLKDITTQAMQQEVKELLEYSVFPDPEAVERAASSYQTGESRLFGYEEDGLLVGVIGFDVEQDELTIRHIAVLPENRGKGYGRGMILELLLELQPKPDRVIAETDEETVDFYRNIGFEVYSQGEKYPGVERFRCIYEVEESEE